MNSRFMSPRHSGLVAYVPGEQPRVLGRLVKLNTNENPYPPSPRAQAAAAAAAADLRLYSDPECLSLRQKLAETYKVDPDEVICANSSDEALDLAFLTFCDADRPAVFPDITYGFYSVFCDLYGIPCRQIPLKDDFTVDENDYLNAKGAVFIANPNAPSGIYLEREKIERILKSDPDRLVVIDEAYIDFGGESCVPLIRKYDNLLVTMTYSKSRCMAGARLGFAIGCRTLIADMNTVRNSRNPYNVNRMTMAAGIGALEDAEYTAECCERIIATREKMRTELEKRGFFCLPSSANFLFARSSRIGGLALYQKLKEKGVFIRHFETERLKDYNRISVGTPEEADILLDRIDKILKEENA